MFFSFWHSIRYILVEYKRYKKMGEFYNPDKLYKGGSRNNSLINKKMILRVLGVLLMIEYAMFLLCVGVYLC